MALPVYYPFKTRVYNCSASSSAVCGVGIAARAKLLSVWIAFNNNNTAAGSVDITVNGSTAVGAIATTTSSANTAQQLYNNFSNTATMNSSGGTIFLNAGDCLGTSLTTVAAGTMTYVVQEF